MRRGLRVAHVLRKYDAAEWGGTETHVAQVTARLGACGWRCEVHAPRGPQAADRALAGDVRLVRYRSFLPVLATPARRRALVGNAGNIVSLDEPLRLALERDLALVHLHTAGRIGGGVRTAMRLTRRPYVVSVHGPKLAAPEFLAAELARRTERTIDLGRPFGALLGARRVLEDADRVICFNDAEHAALAGRVGRRAVRMDHGVDAGRFAAGDAARARADWPHLGGARTARPRVVLQVARLCEQKDQVLSVRAFARAAPGDAVLVLAGPETDRGYRARVEAAVAECGVAHRVHLLGNVAPDRIPDLLALACVVLVPSRHEAFGLSVLEAWAARRPVLFAAEHGLADLARALPAGAAPVAARDEESFAAALARFLADDALREGAAADGAALVRARFDWDAVTRTLAALYEEVLEERQGGRP